MKIYPRIEGTLLIEIENDNVFHSDDKSAEINDLFATVELATGIYASQHFSLQTLIVLEPVRDPLPFKDRTFGDQGAYVQNIFAQYENDRIRLFVGKFDASFGTAWDAAPGVFGSAFAEDYELAERIGGGVAATFETMYLGSHTLTVNAFFTDTTALSESAFTNRGRTRRTAGGASNTESPESFSITLDSEGFADAPELTTHIGFVHQAAGIGDAGDENGFVIGVGHEHEFSNGTTLATILEFAHLSHAGGGAANNTYITAGTQYFFGPWNIATSGTIRRIHTSGAPSVNDHIFQIGGGYEVQQGFLEGTAIDVALGFQSDGGTRSKMFGIIISREFNFELAAR